MSPQLMDVAWTRCYVLPGGLLPLQLVSLPLKSVHLREECWCGQVIVFTQDITKPLGCRRHLMEDSLRHMTITLQSCSGADCGQISGRQYCPFHVFFCTIIWTPRCPEDNLQTSPDLPVWLMSWRLCSFESVSSSSTSMSR